MKLPLKPNLYRDAPLMIARDLIARLESTRGQQRIVWVSPEGFVSSALKWEAAKAKNPRPDEDIVGTYDRNVTLAQIHDDLKAHMAEVAKAMLKRAA